MHFIHNSFSWRARKKHCRAISMHCAIHYRKFVKMRAPEKCIRVPVMVSAVSKLLSAGIDISRMPRAKSFTADSAAFTTQCSLSRCCSQEENVEYTYIWPRAKTRVKYCDIHYGEKSSENIIDTLDMRIDVWSAISLRLLTLFIDIFACK